MVTYIPVPTPAGPTTVNILKKKQRLTSSRPWPDDWVTTTYAPMEWFVNSGRSVSKGKKVIINGHSWSPVRPYTRFGQQGAPSGSEMLMYNKYPNGTILTHYIGVPRIYPRALSLIFPLSGWTKGLTDANGLPILDTNTRSRLITECMVKVGDRKVNYGESLGESRQTLNHLAKTSSRVVRGVLALRRGNLSGFANAIGISMKRGQRTKFPAQSWLEYQYAWMPLLSDIYDTRELLKKGLGKKPQIISATRSTTINEQYDRPGSYAHLKGPIQVRHRAKLWYGISNRHILRLNQLGLINPVEVAWALMPFSFVIDWFLPVQNVLEAHSATMGLSFIDGCMSSSAHIVARGTHDSSSSSNQYASDERFEWICSSSGFRRTKIVSPTPELYYKSPFSTKHVISAIALLRQLKR